MSKNPLGFGEKLSQLNRKQEGKSKERMAAEREQKQTIGELLTNGKHIIDKAWKKARENKQNTFTLPTKVELTANGLLTREEVATVIRRWIFENYQGQLGLYLYSDRPQEIHFSVTNEE